MPRRRYRHRNRYPARPPPPAPLPLGEGEFVSAGGRRSRPPAWGSSGAAVALARWGPTSAPPGHRTSQLQRVKLLRLAWLPLLVCVSMTTGNGSLTTRADV